MNDSSNMIHNFSRANAAIYATALLSDMNESRDLGMSDMDVIGKFGSDIGDTLVWENDTHFAVHSRSFGIEHLIIVDKAARETVSGTEVS